MTALIFSRFILFRPQQSSVRGWDAEAIVKITDNQILHDVIRLSVVVMHQYCFFTNKQQISPTVTPCLKLGKSCRINTQC